MVRSFVSPLPLIILIGGVVYGALLSGPDTRNAAGWRLADGIREPTVAQLSDLKNLGKHNLNRKGAKWGALSDTHRPASYSSII